MVALARTPRESIEIEPNDGREPNDERSAIDSRSATKILSRAVRARAIRWGEALGLPARALGGLPLAPSMGLRVAGVPGHVRVELAADRAEAARARGEVVIDAAEWEAIGLGAEADRLWPVDFSAFCARKRNEPAFRIDAEAALAGAQPDPAEEWPVSRVLDRIGAEVVSIELE